MIFLLFLVLLCDICFNVMCLFKLKQDLWKLCRLILPPGVLWWGEVHIHASQPSGKFKRKRVEYSDDATGRSNFLSLRTLKGLTRWGFQELPSLGIRVTFIVSSWSSGLRVEAWGRHRLIHGPRKVDEGNWGPEAKELGFSNITRIPDHPPPRVSEKETEHTFAQRAQPSLFTTPIKGTERLAGGVLQKEGQNSGE